MTFTTASETLLKISDIQVSFEIDHYKKESLRDHFVSALSHPISFFFHKKELFRAIDGVSLDIKKGMRIGILGVNGSGKTTLCRCLAGMVVPEKGQINAFGEVRAIFDTGSGVLPELTGRENAMLLARMFYPGEK